MLKPFNTILRERKSESNSTLLQQQLPANQVRISPGKNTQQPAYREDFSPEEEPGQLSCV